MNTKRRKIIRFGQKALGITLPREFINKSGLEKGDVVGVTYDSILVIVKPEEPPKEQPNADA